MSRKPKKGYYVRGQFVALGSELDLELQRELKGSDESKTDLKRESAELQDLGEALVALPANTVAAIGLPDRLVDALSEARRITNFEGKRRQMQFIGKLMRQLDEASLAAAREALDTVHRGTAEQTQALHEVELWRDLLIADEDSLVRWMAEHPTTDSQQLRALLRQARKDAAAAAKAPAGQAPRQGRAYRDLFQLLRTHLLADNDGAPPHLEDPT